MREYVLQRDGKCLLWYSPECNGKAETAHHTQPRAVVGDDPRFIIAACGPCNYSYGDPTQAKHGDPAPTPNTRW